MSRTPSLEQVGLPLDPDVAALLDREVRELRTMEPQDLAGMRSTLDAVLGLRRGPGHTDEPVASVEDAMVGHVPVRIYRPVDPPEHLVVFLHGGGWVFGDLDSHDDHARALCRRTRSVVVSVAYRLAPEAPFPAPLQDCVDVVAWAHARSAELVGAVRPVTIAGDSAGGNLAMVAALVARREGLAEVEALCLIYPVLDARPRPAGAYPAEPGTLTTGAIEYFARCYVPADHPREDSLVSPALAPDLVDLPPVLLVSAAHDPLRVQADDLSELLTTLGVTHRHVVYPGMVHGFVGMAPVVPAAAHAVQHVCDQLLALWTGSPAGPA